MRATVESGPGDMTKMSDANGYRRLSAEQVDRFQRNGYVRLGRLLDDDLPVSFARPLLRMRA